MKTLSLEQLDEVIHQDYLANYDGAYDSTWREIETFDQWVENSYGKEWDPTTELLQTGSATIEIGSRKFIIRLTIIEEE